MSGPTDERRALSAPVFGIFRDGCDVEPEFFRPGSGKWGGKPTW